jgi:arylsulfatase A-like enzyme
MLAKRRPTLSATLAVLLGILASSLGAAEAERPNVVLIMTDNHAPWTLGCYGNPEIRTPSIDRLAAGGVLFTRCFSSNAVCSPTRATYLTGLMPSQHGVHCWLAGGRLQIGPDARNTLSQFRSLPEVLAESGYVCGLSGKWHLGDNLHPQEGFTYWVTKPHGHTTAFYDVPVIENGKIRNEPSYTTEHWTEHAVRFIQQNRGRPFFLFLAYNGPYGLGGSLLGPARNRHAEFYADKPMESFPREEPHPWLVNNRQYINNIQAMRRYAAEISGVDDGVGRVVETLERLGLTKNTLVIFTADQGLCGGHHGMWGMGDHSRPLHTFDETSHVPLILSHPGAIPPGRKSELMVSNYDLMPTVLSYLGLSDKMPKDPPRPGRDYSPVLRGEEMTAEEWENVIFYEYENSRMIRTPEWKYTERFPDGPNELYDLARDPGERNNLASRPEHAEIQRRLQARLDEFFARYADPKYDLKHGGGSQSILLTRRKPKR